MSGVNIIRRVHNANYTIIGNRCLQDETLSAESLGVLCYLLGKPNDWQVMMADLMRRFGCGRDKMQRIIRELIEVGYVHREQAREAGAFGSTRYVVYSDPDSPQPENPVTAPQPEKPATAKPAPGNPPLLNTESNKELIVSSQAREKPDDGWPDDFLDQFWTAFPPYRREGKRKVGEKLARLRRDRVVPWTELIGAVRRFAATNPGEFAPAPMVWLNGERWDREYGNRGGANETNRNGGGKTGFSGLAAKLRQGIREQELADRGHVPEDLSPLDGR